jgi:glycosyltransferase involved in cell wall biosynthesis
MTEPLISVLLPVYNGEKYLRAAIESILAQTYSHFELIAVDDGSKDGSISIVKEYQARDERVILHAHEKNLGIVAALNDGLSLSRGELIARMDSDDISLPTRFEKQVTFLNAHPNIGVLGTAAEVINASGQIYDRMEYPASHLLLQWSLCFYCPMIHPTIMARREILLSASGYSADYPHAEDYDLWARLSADAQFANLSECLLALRKHEENVSVSNSALHFESSAKISRKLIRSQTGYDLQFVPLELAQQPRRIPSSEMQQLAQAIIALMDRFSLNIPPVEKRFLRRETALQLFRLVRNADSFRAALNVLIRALRVDPLSFSHALRLAMRKSLPRA